MVSLALAGLFGLIGGLIRALAGIMKHYRIDKNMKFKSSYLIKTLLVSAFIGMLVSLAFSTNYFVYLIMGYVGTDFLENILRIVRKTN